MSVVMDSVKEMTGFDLSDTMKAHTYDAKVNKNIELNGLSSNPTVVTSTALEVAPTES